MTVIPAAPRFCYFVDEATRTPAGYVAARVTEGSPGYELMSDGRRDADPWCWGTDLASARRRADDANHRLGIGDCVAEQLVGRVLAMTLVERMRRERLGADQRRLHDALGRPPVPAPRAASGPR